MLKYALLLAASAVALATPANAATTIVLVPDGNTYTGEFTGHVSTAGAFSYDYTFDLSDHGTLAASIVTIAVDAKSNIDFTSVLLNGTPFTLSPTGTFEYGYLTNLLVPAGTQTLTVMGMSGKNAGFSGTVSFVAAPEPATWALMMLGFGIVGGVMRRSRRQRVTVRTNFDLA